MTRSPFNLTSRPPAALLMSGFTLTPPVAARTRVLGVLDIVRSSEWRAIAGMLRALADEPDAIRRAA